MTPYEQTVHFLFCRWWILLDIVSPKLLLIWRWVVEEVDSSSLLFFLTCRCPYGYVGSYCEMGKLKGAPAGTGIAIFTQITVIFLCCSGCFVVGSLLISGISCTCGGLTSCCQSAWLENTLELLETVNTTSWLPELWGFCVSHECLGKVFEELDSEVFSTVIISVWNHSLLSGNDRLSINFFPCHVLENPRLHYVNFQKVQHFLVSFPVKLGFQLVSV